MNHSNLGPNVALLSQPNSRNRLLTPALVLDLEAFEQNVSTMARLAEERGIQLRPHAKSHKSARIARMQIDAGAIGVCVATLREANVMVMAGIPGVHITTPVVGLRPLQALVAVSASAHGLSVVVDNLENLEELEACIRQGGQNIEVLVDVDLGAMFRTGVQSAEHAVQLAQAIAGSDVLRYAGVQYYSGIVQHIPSVSERAGAYQIELERLADLMEKLSAGGLRPRKVSGGGTGTFELDACSKLLTENQAGSYIFMDVEYERVDLLQSTPHPFRPALFVQATVISNNARGVVTIDAGTKAVATDGPSPRLVSGSAQAVAYHNFGDEFGLLAFGGLAERSRQSNRREEPAAGALDSYRRFHELFDSAGEETKYLSLGDKVELLVPHCDPTVNLHDYYHCVRGDTLVDIWPIDARGHL